MISRGTDGETTVCDKGYAGAELVQLAFERRGAVICARNRKTESSRGPHFASIRQRIQSMSWMLEDRLGSIATEHAPATDSELDRATKSPRCSAASGSGTSTS